MAERPLFTTVPPEPEETADPGWDERRMSIIEHLEELRRVLIVSLSAWGIASVVGVILSGFAITLLAQPLKYLAKVNADATRLHYLSPMGYFTIHLKVGIVLGLAIALPVVLWQIWSFVAPGLRPVERRFAGPLLASSLLLFALGAGLAYLFLYIAVRIIGAVSGSGSDLVFFPEATAYLGFVVILMLAFALTFEFPVALVLMATVGLVKSSQLARWRRGAYLLIAAAGYVVTPGVDPVTPLALIIPLLLLYEGSIFVIRRMKH
ncbi:MAG TPA: twin-arginine translocase subunit TatC [Candidatus Dormibacteraeota bacterium]|jgi:sec-independent protein translocase protein TatC|nr:twin-arginine translocase subunit TatC [Candidatus Dormibacteraeota bacterium]